MSGVTCHLRPRRHPQVSGLADALLDSVPVVAITGPVSPSRHPHTYATTTLSLPGRQSLASLSAPGLSLSVFNSGELTSLHSRSPHARGHEKWSQLHVLSLSADLRVKQPNTILNTLSLSTRVLFFFPNTHPDTCIHTYTGYLFFFSLSLSLSLSSCLIGM
ncbi:unnamed protein product [Camellia sinensis]